MLICPICGEELSPNKKSLLCVNKHCFDFAKQGYINLLPVQQKKSLHPGDSREMLLARRNFLSKGFYSKILDTVAVLIEKYSKNPQSYLDIGCGEGYYTAGICDKIPFKCAIGTDIAKEAVKMCCSRTKDIEWVVATASHLPVKDNSIDVITAIFSLVVPGEYYKKLNKGGIIIEVSAGNNHLIELKREIYDNVFEQNKRQGDVSEFFTTLYQGKIEFSLSLQGDDLRNLLTMTPHINRINIESKNRLYSLSHLDLTVDCNVRVLVKN